MWHKESVGKVSEARDDVGGAHFGALAHAVEGDVAFDPADVSLLYADALG